MEENKAVVTETKTEETKKKGNWFVPKTEEGKTDKKRILERVGLFLGGAALTLAVGVGANAIEENKKKKTNNTTDNG